MIIAYVITFSNMNKHITTFVAVFQVNLFFKKKRDIPVKLLKKKGITINFFLKIKKTRTLFKNNVTA